MGFRYQELKDRGDSIELERRESFTTERSHNGYIKRKKTVVRERFHQPHAKGVKHHKKQQTPQSEVLTTQRQGAESGRTTTETFGYSPGNQTLISHCRDKSHLERAVNRTSVQLKRLAHEIDHEIEKLKRERDKLMLRPHPHPLMRNAAIQNDLQCDDVPKTATTNAKLKHFNAIADNIEFTIEKFSSQHKFVCTSPRYARDEQTSCRPRMRTIGLQKDTHRNPTGVFSDSLQNIKVKLGTALQNSATNLANLKATGLLDPAPPNCYAFDYGGTGDGQNALKVYHLQNCRYAGGCNPNVDCNCQKICERYNTIGNYNGMLCNKNTYVEKGVTPCSKYKYCRDEYHYDYPQQNSPCRPCTPCLTYQQNQQPCQPYIVPCIPPCPTYNESQPTKPKLQVIYGRRMSDLNTDEFYHPTAGSSPTKLSPTKHGSGRRASTKERLTVDVPKDGRTSVDIERHGGRTQNKSRRRKEDEATKKRDPKPYETGSPDKTNFNRQLRERNSHRKSDTSSSADSTEKLRNLKNKEKLLEITFTKERRRRASSGSGDEPYELQPDRDYTREAKRSMKQMTITAYKPRKPVDSEGETDAARKKKNTRKSKSKNADKKFEDDKTWDERLRRYEPEPRVDQPQDEEDGRRRAVIPTIEELYDNYRVGDAWEAEEYNVSQQQYAGAYRESFQASPRRSYDIMPVQRDTVRDIPPVHSPVRGQRLYREEQRDHNEDHVVNRSQTPYARSTAESIGQNGQLKTGKGYAYGVRPDSIGGYSVEDKSRPIGKSAVRHDYETGRSYLPGDKSRPQRNSYSPRETDERYMGHRSSREDGESSNIPKSRTAFIRGEKPSSARGYDYGPQSDKKRIDETALHADYERASNITPGTIHALDRKPRSARDSILGDKKYLKEDSPSRAGYELHKSTAETVNNLEGTPDSARENSLNAIPKAERRFMGDRSAPYPEYEHKPTTDAIYAPDGKLRLARDHGQGVEPKEDKIYVGESSSRADYEPAKPKSSAFDTPIERTLSAQDYDQNKRPELDKTHNGDIYEPSSMPTSGNVYAQEKMQSPRDYDSGVQSTAPRSHLAKTKSNETPELKGGIHSRLAETPQSPRDYDSGIQSTPARSHDTNITSHKTPELKGGIHSRSAQEKLQSPRDYDSGAQSIPTRSQDAKITSHETPDFKGSIHSRSAQGKLQSPRDYDSGGQSTPERSQDAKITSHETLDFKRSIHSRSAQEKLQSPRDYDSGAQSIPTRSQDAKITPHETPDFKGSIHSRSAQEKLQSPRDYDSGVQSTPARSQDAKITSHETPHFKGSIHSRSAQEKLQSPGDYDSGVQATPARSHDANTTSHETRETKGGIHSQDKKHQELPKFQDAQVIPTTGKLSPLAKQTSHQMQEKSGSGRLRGDVSKGAYDGYASNEKTPIDWDGKSQIQEGYAEKVKVDPSGEYIVAGKTDASAADMRRGVVEKISPLKVEKPETGSAGPQTRAVPKKTDSPSDSGRTGRDLAYYGPEVPEIHIEDNDESGRSGMSGKEESARISLPERAKFAIQGEMVLEPHYGRDNKQPARTEPRTKQGGRTGSLSGTYRMLDTIHSAEQTGIPKSGLSNPITESSERLRIVHTFDESQQLSPFPSLESPRIYMRPRTKCPDYGTACLPPSSDCPKKSNTRGNCVDNAGDVYMCQQTSYNPCQPSPPCPCLTSSQSCNEIPYEKLGDQYTHSPVRQLAANSHLAVALQPDSAIGNYIPSPQPKTSKNCIYLRTTGTQYSATIIENHEDRCAPQYIPLPKDCNIPLPSLEEQNRAPAICCPQSCDDPCENFQTVSCTPQNNFSFLCEEEENEEYEDKINMNNDQWCQSVESTNSQKQAKENSPRFDCKNYFLPWQQDQKFIPGQPVCDCDVQDGEMQQRSRYQSLADRRITRFNATMPPHQEMPEEEARCAEEMSMYKPQPRVQFIEQNLRQYENSDSCYPPQEEESKFRAESMEPTNSCGTSERPGFNDCREFQQIPQFTGCPCMFKTYLNMVTLYYPDCRIQMTDDGGDEEEDGCCNDGKE